MDYIIFEWRCVVMTGEEKGEKHIIDHDARHLWGDVRSATSA